jgi:hypothetical protein
MKNLIQFPKQPCTHSNTVFGECADCGQKLQIEGTFSPVNPDKSRYLDARKA